jgi:hypothetical protein
MKVIFFFASLGGLRDETKLAITDNEAAAIRTGLYTPQFSNKV